MRAHEYHGATGAAQSAQPVVSWRKSGCVRAVLTVGGVDIPLRDYDGMCGRLDGAVVKKGCGFGVQEMSRANARAQVTAELEMFEATMARGEAIARQIIAYAHGGDFTIVEGPNASRTAREIVEAEEAAAATPLEQLAPDHSREEWDAWYSETMRRRHQMSRPYRWYPFGAWEWLAAASVGVAVEYFQPGADPAGRAWAWCAPDRAMSLAEVPPSTEEYRKTLQAMSLAEFPLSAEEYRKTLRGLIERLAE